MQNSKIIQINYISKRYRFQLVLNDFMKQKPAVHTQSEKVNVRRMSFDTEYIIYCEGQISKKLRSRR